MFQKDMSISLLLDFYGDILSARRREIVEMYYNEDLSLSEIAEITGISRQGVRDSIKKSEKELLQLEETLGLVERFGKLKAEIGSISSDLGAIIESTDNKELKEKLEAEIKKLETLDI